MRLSNYLLPTLKEDPREAQITSHKLMIRAGMIRQLTSGIYNWLPLGLKTLKNIENIVRKELNKSGCIELLMPTMQPSDLWDKSGRGNYGNETLSAQDRHGNKLIYGPTNEEVISDLVAKTVKSYKDLPLNLYHMQWKFRDEIRPRFGVMRGREFYMKDAYSFDITEENAIKSYNKMLECYLKIFKKLGLKAIPFKADTGQIGGDLSHEFQVIAETGESEIIFEKAYEEELSKDNPSADKLKSMYARTIEMHDANKCDIKKENLIKSRGIEVGHIFYLNDKYSNPMGAKIQLQDGSEKYLKMGCYGIGISRLIAAIIECHHDEKGIIWPKNIAPFKVIIINLKASDEAVSRSCEEIYNNLQDQNIEAIYDDTDENVGAKFARADLIGIPIQIIVGPRTVKNNEAEIRFRGNDNATKQVNLAEVENFVRANI